MVSNLPTGTVTFLFTDIEGSTNLAQELPDSWESLRERHNAILRSAMESYNGYVFQIIGDAFCVAFHTAEDALQASIKSQIDLNAEGWGNFPIKVRMGIHTGKAEVQGSGEYRGYISLSRVQRLMAAGHGGQTLISSSTQELVRDELPQDISLRDLGERRLKDLNRPEHLYQLLIPNLPTEFPPLKTLETFHTNLPAQLSSFIGREREIEEVRRLLKKERLVTLAGAGGSGKTRLALQAAADILDTFRDGVWFVDLAPLSNPAFLPQVVAAVLNLHEEAGCRIQDALADYLRLRSVLLILDNCEHLVEACAVLAGCLLQACPQLHILATSREALGIASEKLLIVPTLSVPKVEMLSGTQNKMLACIQESEAVQLFVERALNVSSSFTLTKTNAIAVVQICDRLDGIPLAIELAAARTRMMTLEQILARLDDRFRLLTGGSRTALPRQQTLHALVDWSHDLLSEPEQHLFGRLSVFAGSWTLEAAEAVCGGSDVLDSDILDLLTRLADKSLVVAEPGESKTRFRMLETIRQYAREQLKTSAGEESIRRRHFAYYFKLVKESQIGVTGPDPSASFKSLDLEKENIYSALGWAVQESVGNADAAQEVSGGLWMWWLARGTLSEGRHWLKKVLEKGLKPSSPRAMALVSAGIMAWQQGDIPEGSRYLDESLSIMRNLESPDLAGLAHATHMLGHTALDTGDYSVAYKAFNESLDLYQKLDDQYYVGTLTSDLGMVAYHQGDYQSAWKYQEQSLVIFQKFGNAEVTSQTLHRIGELARLQGDYEQAEEYYETCLRNYREIGMKLEVASNLHKLGYIAQHHGDFKKARSLFNKSLSTQHEVGNKQGIAECLAGLAGLAAVGNQPVRALRLYGAAQTLLNVCKVPLAPADQAEWKRDYAFARGQLNVAACDKAQNEGLAMGLEQAIEYASQKYSATDSETEI